MADGLFGAAPWEVEQQQQQAQHSRAMEMSKMDANQWANYGLMSGTAGLARMLGAKNPAVEQAKRQEQIMGQGEDDLGTSAGLFAKAKQFMDAGDRTTATKLLFKANEFKRQEAAAALAAQKETRAQTKQDFDMEERFKLDKEVRLGQLENKKKELEQQLIIANQSDATRKEGNQIRLTLGQLANEIARLRVEAKSAAAGAGGTAPPKNLTREARLGWELENGMIDQATYDAAMSASPGGVLRQKQVESANTARSSFDAVKRNIDQLYDDQSGSLKPAARSLFGQYAQYRPEMSMSQESVDAKLALEGLTDQVMMANLADAKARVGQSFGSMQVQEWDKFTQQLTSLKRGLSEKQAAESMKYVLNFIKTKGDVLETALNKPNTISPPATKPQAASDFNSKWAALKSGQSLVGPDGKTYTKK